MYLNFPLLFAIPSIAFTMEEGEGILDQFDHERFFDRVYPEESIMPR